MKNAYRADFKQKIHIENQSCICYNWRRLKEARSPLGQRMKPLNRMAVQLRGSS